MFCRVVGVVEDVVAKRAGRDAALDACLTVGGKCAVDAMYANFNLVVVDSVWAVSRVTFLQSSEIDAFAARMFCAWSAPGVGVRFACVCRRPSDPAVLLRLGRKEGDDAVLRRAFAANQKRTVVCIAVYAVQRSLVWLHLACALSTMHPHGRRSPCHVGPVFVAWPGKAPSTRQWMIAQQQVASFEAALANGCVRHQGDD